MVDGDNLKALELVYLQKSGDKSKEKIAKFFFSNCSQTFFIFLYISEPSKTKISSQVRLSLNFYSYLQNYIEGKNVLNVTLSFCKLLDLGRISKTKKWF